MLLISFNISLFTCFLAAFKYFPLSRTFFANNVLKIKKVKEFSQKLIIFV